MTDIGPVHLIVAGFAPEAQYEGKIMEEFRRIEESGAMRVLDVLFVRKDEDGVLTALDVQGGSEGGIVGDLLGIELDGSAPGERVDTDMVGITRSEIVDLAEELEPGQAAGMVLLQHVWARDLGRAIQETGGAVLAQQFMSGEELAQLSPEVAARAAALDS